jgi:hypothetical protein
VEFSVLPSKLLEGVSDVRDVVQLEAVYGQQTWQGRQRVQHKLELEKKNNLVTTKNKRKTFFLK